MRRLSVLLLLASLYPQDASYAQPAGYNPAPPPPPPYAGRQGNRGGGAAYSQENCGTPDEPKSCPPLPRNPLPYYPANKQ